MVNKAKTTPRVFKLREWNIGNYLQRCCKHWKSKGGSETWTKLPHYRSSLVAQTVKNPPAVQGTWIRSLGQEDPWQPTPVFFLGEFHGQRSLVGCSPWGCKESDTTESLSHTHTHTHTPALLELQLVSAHCADLRTCQPSHHMSQLHIKNHFITRDSYRI